MLYSIFDYIKSQLNSVMLRINLILLIYDCDMHGRYFRLVIQHRTLELWYRIAKIRISYRKHAQNFNFL
jgi:hypothetical protein